MFVTSWWKSVLTGCRTDGAISSIFCKGKGNTDNGFDARKHKKNKKKIVCACVREDVNEMMNVRKWNKNARLLHGQLVPYADSGGKCGGSAINVLTQTFGSQNAWKPSVHHAGSV